MTSKDIQDFVVVFYLKIQKAFVTPCKLLLWEVAGAGAMSSMLPKVRRI